MSGPGRWSCAAAVLMLLTGCGFKGGAPATRPGGGGGAPVSPALASQPAYWQPRPVRLRVAPITRYTLVEGKPVLEACLELTDEMGDPIKGAGQYRFELFSAARLGDAGIANRLRVWDAAVLSLEDQRRNHDPVTQTYRFLLGLPDAAGARQTLVLQATFVPVEGRRLETRVVLTGDGPVDSGPEAPE